MSDETMTEETVTEGKKSTRKAYFYDGRKVSLKEHAQLMERDAKYNAALADMERAERQRALRRLQAFMDVTPLPPIESRTDEWLEAYMAVRAELAYLND